MKSNQQNGTFQTIFFVYSLSNICASIHKQRVRVCVCCVYINEYVIFCCFLFVSSIVSCCLVVSCCFFSAVSLYLDIRAHTHLDCCFMPWIQMRLCLIEEKQVLICVFTYEMVCIKYDYVSLISVCFRFSVVVFLNL